MIAIEILIPLFSNEGDEFTADHHGAFESVLTDTFGGFTRPFGVVLGGWQSAGIVYVDKSQLYVVGITSMLIDGHKVLHVVDVAKTHYSQLAIFVRYLGMAEII
jgi:hypothetical protein